MMRTLARPCFSLFAALIACGGGGGSDPEDAGPGRDLAPAVDGFTPDSFTPPDMGLVIDDPEVYRDAYIEMLCRAYFECLNRHTALFAPFVDGLATEEECAESGRMDLYVRFMPLPESIADGHVAFDGERAVECLESREAFLCDETATEPRGDDPCDEVFTGLRESGETCREGECVDDYSCSTGGSCHGTCAPTMPICPDCPSGEYCDSVAMDCAPLLAEGESCFQSYACQEGLVCDEDGSGGDCVTAGSRSEGATCLNNDVCGEGLYCHSNQCAPYSIGGAGEQCGDSRLCEPGLICTLRAGESFATCKTPRALGESCTSTTQCGFGLYCDTVVTEECVSLRSNGESCVGNVACESSYCPSPTNECAALPICEIP